MEKNESNILIFKTLVNLGAFLLVLSVISPILKFVSTKPDGTSIDCYFNSYFISGIVSIVVAMIYAAFNSCKCKKQEPNTKKPQKTKEEIDTDYQREQEKLRALREHEERMAIIKALGANYAKQNADAIQVKLKEIVKTLDTIKHS